MKILKFTGNLADIMGDDSRGSFGKDSGLKYYEGHQNLVKKITLFEVVDEEKAKKYINHKQVETLDEIQANEILFSDMDKILYKKYDGDLYRVNLQQKTDIGIVNLDLMLPEWTEQQELDFLYNKGLSGINKKEIIVEKFQPHIIQEPEEPVTEEPEEPVTEDPEVI